MIGDPKQAIYGFRGADIFTYIGAKNGVDTPRQFTLKKNYRSATSVVENINTLFSNNPNSFYGNGSVKDMCACYMEQSFYNDHYNKLSEALGDNFIYAQGTIPECTYSQCAKTTGSWRNFDLRNCPATTNCFNEINFIGDSNTIDIGSITQTNNCQSIVNNIVNKETCDNSRCIFNGTCNDLGECICNDGYSGEYCTQEIGDD